MKSRRGKTEREFEDNVKKMKHFKRPEEERMKKGERR